MSDNTNPNKIKVDIKVLGIDTQRINPLDYIDYEDNEPIQLKKEIENLQKRTKELLVDIKILIDAIFTCMKYSNTDIKQLPVELQEVMDKYKYI